ncbi:MAG: tRNA 5-hydroxyuridine modification protein YegQ [Betaproteobacteria bacterium]|nr:tRNA 5-hydroxyuridine modification protein YegQ [Betaproteobacteria bacterium]
MRHKPELLLPAGNLEKLRYAFLFGADAVYAGQPRYSLRARNNEFQLEQLATGIEHAHALGKKFYVASNLMAHNAKVKTYARDMAAVIACGPDALIMADPGLIGLVRERWPEMPIHLSVQANTVNHAAVKFWKAVGLARVILSRELSLSEIEEIRQQCPDMELEVFIHGALCIAYSGRCLLSGYFNHRDANQGTCTNSCRWEYALHPAQEDASGNVGLRPAIAMGSDGTVRHPLADGLYLLEESARPQQFMPILEDEHGTYILNSKDLRGAEHVERLVQLGIDSLKIEGRTKSTYYVARTAQVYRKAIDDGAQGRPFDPACLNDLESLASRGYTAGFFDRHAPESHQNYRQGHSESKRAQYVGDILAHDTATGLSLVCVKNRFRVGDWLEIMHPSGNRRLRLTHMVDEGGSPVSEAPGSGYRVRIPLDGPLEDGLVVRLTGAPGPAGPVMTTGPAGRG